jgi:hypothetical protein
MPQSLVVASLKEQKHYFFAVVDDEGALIFATANAA